MYDLRSFRLKDTIECASHMRKIGAAAQSMEEASTRIARFLYEALLDGTTTRPACALVRVYKTHPFGRLDAARAAFAASLAEGGAPGPDTVCMTLAATAGELPAWCSVTGSKGHQAIPLTSPSFLDRLPMISALFDQLGLDREAVLHPDAAAFARMLETTCDVFFVPEAVSSPIIPAQRDFVIPHGIRSVLGFGGALPSGEVFVVLLFSKVPISAEVAGLFKVLAPSIRLAMARFGDRTLFAPMAPKGAEGASTAGEPPQSPDAPLREDLAMTNALLGEMERVSCEQEDRLERLLAELSGGHGVLSATIDGIADAVAVVDEHGRFIRLNTAAQQVMGDMRDAGLEKWKNADWLLKADGVTPFLPDELPLARALRGEHVENVEMYICHPPPKEGRWLLMSVRPIRVEGKDRGAVLIFRDITEKKLREIELERQLVREKERNDLLERMKDALQQLSTPILEVWEDVLALPVIGVVDSMRAAEMMERVLAEVERRQCRYLIIDITGVDVIDTATADRFAKLVTAVEILGAQCFLTGARAMVAQTMASLGVDMGRMTTLRTLKHALGECMRLTAANARRPRLEDLLSGKKAARE